MRLRLDKMPFLKMAKYQIEGGVWYKVRCLSGCRTPWRARRHAWHMQRGCVPRGRACASVCGCPADTRTLATPLHQPGWYDAARRVPPAAFQPRPHKKKQVPTLRWPEDALIRCGRARAPRPLRSRARRAHRRRAVPSPGAPRREFQERNPGLVSVDPADTERPERHVAAQFARRQLAAMEEGLSREEAYAEARKWALENGRALAAQLHMPDEAVEELTPDPLLAMKPRAMMAETLRRQKEQIKQSLAQDLKAKPESLGEWGSVEPYKHWMSDAQLARLAHRQLGDAEDEAEAGAAAGGAGGAEEVAGGR